MEKTEQVVEKEVNLENGDDMVITLKKPINFEGESYDKIDLNGLNELKTSDMVSINRRLLRNGIAEANQELTLEYALNMANLATKLPLEFFNELPPYAAMKIKIRVASFLFGQE